MGSVSDYQTFRTRQAAQAEAAQMRRYGWPRATVDRVLWGPEDPGGPEGPVWVWIVCATHGAGMCQYLRADGYVR